MNKDTIIKVLLAIIALMVFAWLWRIISGMLIGTLVAYDLTAVGADCAYHSNCASDCCYCVCRKALYQEKVSVNPMALFAKKKPPEPAAADEQKISLALTPDEIDLLRECMKRTEDYYRGLLLLKQDWNAAQNEAAIAMIKARLNMIDKLQEKTLYDGQSEYYRNLQ